MISKHYFDTKVKCLQSVMVVVIIFTIYCMYHYFVGWDLKIAAACVCISIPFICNIYYRASELYHYRRVHVLIKHGKNIRNNYPTYHPTLPIEQQLFPRFMRKTTNHHSLGLTHYPNTSSTMTLVNTTANVTQQRIQYEPQQEQNNEFTYNAMEQTNENDYPIATYHPTAYQQAVVPTYCPQQEQKQSFIGNNEFNGPLYQYTPIRPEQTGFGTNISIPDNNPYLPQRNNYRHQHNPQTVNINTSFGPLSSFKFTYEKTPAKNEVIACKESEKVVHGYVKTFYAKALALALLNIIIEYSNVTDLWSKDSDKIIKRSDDRTGISTGCCDKYVVALGSKIVTKLWKEVWTVRFKNNVSVPIIGIVEKGCTSRQDAIVVYATSWRTLFVVDLELDMKQETLTFRPRGSNDCVVKKVDGTKEYRLFVMMTGSCEIDLI
eukprot:76390_1